MLLLLLAPVGLNSRRSPQVWYCVSAEDDRPFRQAAALLASRGGGPKSGAVGCAERPRLRLPRPAGGRTLTTMRLPFARPLRTCPRHELSFHAEEGGTTVGHVPLSQLSPADLARAGCRVTRAVQARPPREERHTDQLRRPPLARLLARGRPRLRRRRCGHPTFHPPGTAGAEPRRVYCPPARRARGVRRNGVLRHGDGGGQPARCGGAPARAASGEPVCLSLRRKEGGSAHRSPSVSAAVLLADWDPHSPAAAEGQPQRPPQQKNPAAGSAVRQSGRDSAAAAAARGEEPAAEAPLRGTAAFGLPPRCVVPIEQLICLCAPRPSSPTSRLSHSSLRCRCPPAPAAGQLRPLTADTP